LRKLSEQFPNELVVIGVHSGKFPTEHHTESIRQAVMRFGIDHPVVNDAEFKIWNSYTVNAWPTLVLIDPRGRIAGEQAGEILAEEFAPIIQEVIDQHRDLLNLGSIDLPNEADTEPERPLRYPARLLAIDDTLFIADTGHHRILEVMLDADGLSGEVKRVFGSGQPGLKDGAGQSAQFSDPHGLGLKGDLQSGTLYVADTSSNTIRAIHLDTQEVQTVAGNGQKGHGRQVLGSAATDIALRGPWAVLPLEQYVLVAMAGSHQIWVLIDEQQIGPFAGTGQEALVDGPIDEASFNQPSDLTLGMGHLFVADAEASAIRAISLGEQPQVMTLVGQGLFAFGDQDGPASEALLQHPTGVDYADRLLYVADTYNNKIKVVDPFGGQVNTLVGSGEAGLSDGTFEQARLFEPEGVQVHRGRLYIADTNNHQIRVADLNHRTVTTFHLKGLERLPAAVAVERPAQTLEAVSGRPGKLWVKLDIQLPEGYHRNPEMPMQLVVGQGAGAHTYSFDAQEDIAFPLEANAGQDIPLDLRLYYCQGGNSALCLIHNQSLVLPVQVEENGGDQVSISYSLSQTPFQ
jgi:DNA-binding beta-propeller fold protein YncE